MVELLCNFKYPVKIIFESCHLFCFPLFSLDLVTTSSYSKYKSSPTVKLSETKPTFMKNLVSLLSSVKKDITTSDTPFGK